MATELSEPALHALGVFGLTTEDARGERADRGARAKLDAARLDARLRPGEIALITGPSGAGKTTLLDALAARLRPAGAMVVDAQEELGRARGPMVIDALAPTSRDVPGALRLLSAAGLADARLPARPIVALSGGERARLALALAMSRAASDSSGAPATILIDEFAATLDDATAEGLCATLRRWIGRESRVRIVAATVRTGIAEWLRPGWLVRLDGNGGAAMSRPEPASDRAKFDIEVGSLADYQWLSALHYRAGKPATCVRVLVARERRGSAAAPPVGVLVVSMPTLNGAWRVLAWPGEYAGRGVSKRAAAARVNRDIRCISRVIVKPRMRGPGVGAALLRAYLAQPLTRRTEAVSAMGAACPIFARAGMREWLPDPPLRDLRLTDALSAAGLRPWMIADIHETLSVCERFPHVEPALRTWARAHGPTRKLAGAPLRDVIRAAARSVVVRPRAYTAERTEP